MRTLSLHLLSRLVAAALLVASGSACRSSESGDPTAAYPAVVSADFGGMRNVSVAGPIWFGASPSGEDLELARRRGIRLVIDLTRPGEEKPSDVATICQRLGLDYIDAHLPDTPLPTSESVDYVLQCLTNDEDAPKLMFDGTGGRCAMFLAIYRAADQKVPLEDALTEARRAGMKPGEPEQFVREQYERLTGEGDDRFGA